MIRENDSLETFSTVQCLQQRKRNYGSQTIGYCSDIIHHSILCAGWFRSAGQVRDATESSDIIAVPRQDEPVSGIEIGCLGKQKLILGFSDGDRQQL